MISLKKILLENEEYSIPGTEFTSGGDAFCKRGAKTKGLTYEQEKVIRDIMLSDPTPEQEDKIKKIMIASQTGQFCRDAGLIANRYAKHNVTRDDLISAGLEKLLKVTWPRINWNAENKIGTFLAEEMRGHLRNAANKEAKKKGLSGVGEEESVGIYSLDTPVSGKDGDDMNAYDFIGGSFDNETEEADFMSRLYRSMKPRIKADSKKRDMELETLQGFLGVDENGKFTGNYRTIKELEKDLGINHVYIRKWWKDYENYILRLKKNNPDLFYEGKYSISKILKTK